MELTKFKMSDTTLSYERGYRFAVGVIRFCIMFCVFSNINYMIHGGKIPNFSIGNFIWVATAGIIFIEVVQLLHTKTKSNALAFVVSTSITAGAVFQSIATQNVFTFICAGIPISFTILSIFRTGPIFWFENSLKDDIIQYVNENAKFLSTTNNGDAIINDAINSVREKIINKD